MEYPIIHSELKQQYEDEQNLPPNLFEKDFYKFDYFPDEKSSPLFKFSYQDFIGDNLQNPIESKLDKEIITLCKIFKTKNSVQRSKIRTSFSNKDFNLLLTFIERASVFVLRGKKEYLEAAVMTIAMIDFSRGDSRYTCMSFAFIEYVIKKLYPEDTSLFILAARFSDSSTTSYLLTIQKRKMSLDYDFGYTPYKLKEGFGFIRCECGGEFEKDKYIPSKDLYIIAHKIMGYLFEKDIYNKGEVVLSTKSPFLVSSTFREYSSVINGKVKLHFVNAKNNTCNSLYFSIIEFTTIENTKAYIQLLGKERTDKYGGHVFNFIDNIVYTITGKSTTLGVQSIENHHTLQRFKEPFEEIIRLG